MKSLFRYLTLVLLITLAACTGTDPVVEPTAPAANPTATSDSQQAYPALPTAEQTTIDQGYPPSTPNLPLPDSYPDPEEKEGVWIIRPVSEQQCTEDGSPPAKTYPDLNAAVSALESNGIEVTASETVGLMVCEACTCPSSEHYRVLINPADLDAALKLDWTEEL